MDPEAHERGFAGRVDDDADVRLAQRGDDRAFERLYTRHARRVRATARWLLGDGELDAVVQDVFVRVWEQLHTYRGEAAFRSWLNRVAVSVILRTRERRGREHARGAGAELLAGHAARDAGAALRTEIEGAVDRLPPRAREVFVLHDMHGFRPAEIAEMLGLALNSVRSQLARARLALRRELSEAMPAPPETVR